MSCFTSCKNIKIEDEQNAKICSKCTLELKAEYTLNQLKLDRPIMKVEPDISKNYPTNIKNGVDPVKLEMKIDEAEKETNVQYQIVFLEPKIKHEPDLIIEDEGKYLK
jgi:pyruvate kinase